MTRRSETLDNGLLPVGGVLADGVTISAETGVCEAVAALAPSANVPDSVMFAWTDWFGKSTEVLTRAALPALSSYRPSGIPLVGKRRYSIAGQQVQGKRC